ncbi:hypothetical protein WN093_13095 [Gammaproteobacteria bacterium AS21]
MPRKVIVSFVLLLSLLAISAGAVFFYYQYKSQQIVNSVVAQLAGVAMIDINETTVDFNGNIFLNQIDIAPNGYIDKIAVDRIEVKTGGPLNILSQEILKDISSSSLELVVSGAVFDLNADFVKARSALSRNQRGRPLWNVACADQSDFYSFLDNAGLSHNQLDALIKINLGANGRSLNLSTSVNVQGMLTASLQLQLTSQSPINVKDNSLLRRAKLSYASLGVNDRGINVKRLKYCAEQEDVAENNYYNFFKENVRLSMLEQTQVDNAALESGVLSLFMPNVKAVASLKPKSPLPLAAVFGGDYDFLTSPDLELAVNGQLASTEYLSLLREASVVGEEVDAVKDEILAEIEEKKAERQRSDKPLAYLDIDMQNIASFTNKSVRLRTTLGKEIEGVITDVQEDKIIMRRRVAQGFVKYPVLKKDIATLKSLR